MLNISERLSDCLTVRVIKTIYQEIFIIEIASKLCVCRRYWIELLRPRLHGNREGRSAGHGRKLWHQIGKWTSIRVIFTCEVSRELPPITPAFGHHALNGNRVGILRVKVDLIWAQRL